MKELICIVCPNSCSMMIQEIGDTIKVKEGPFEDFIGAVESISHEKRKIKAFVSMFGRETLIELDYDQIEKV